MAKLGEGLIVALVGISIVFIGLFIIIGFIMLFSAILSGFGKKEAAPVKAAPAPAPAAAPVEEPVIEETDDGELVAVISAALAAFMASENTTDGKKLVVRRIRKVSGWNNTSREEQVYRF